MTPILSGALSPAARAGPQSERELGEQTRAAYPQIVSGVRGQRAFLASAVRYLVTHAGVRQFLEIGTGLPVGRRGRGLRLLRPRPQAIADAD